MNRCANIVAKVVTVARVSIISLYHEADVKLTQENKRTADYALTFYLMT